MRKKIISLEELKKTELFSIERGVYVMLSNFSHVPKEIFGQEIELEFIDEEFYFNRISKDKRGREHSKKFLIHKELFLKS
jgi:hypothetical protein